MLPNKQAILVGFDGKNGASDLIVRLESQGFKAGLLTSAAKLARMLDQAGRTVLLVSCRDGVGDALEAIALTNFYLGKVAVVALVREADASQYHLLMRAGVAEYFEASESLEVIVRGVAMA